MSGVRLAIVGYGRIAEKHLEVFRALGAEVVAACNRTETNRQRASRQGGIGRVYKDPLEMVERERPDGILVTTSVMTVYEVTRELVPAGIPMLVEKPPGTSLDEARELSALAAEHSTPVMVGLNRRFYSVYHDALRRMGGREAVTGVWVEWSEDPLGMLDLGHPPELLPLLVFGNSLHGIDLLSFFAGGVSLSRVWGRNLDPTGISLRWQMSLDGMGPWGAVQRFCSSWDVPGRWRLVVDAHACRLLSAPLETSLLAFKDHTVEIQPSPEDQRFKPGFYAQAQAFLSVVQDRAPIAWPACPLNEAVGSMLLAQGLTDTCRGLDVGSHNG